VQFQNTLAVILALALVLLLNMEIMQIKFAQPVM
jgi:hypothetical protein